MTFTALSKDQNILGGVPVFRNTRVPFQALLDYLEAGQPLDDFLNDFPTVTREAAIAALEEAKVVVAERMRSHDIQSIFEEANRLPSTHRHCLGHENDDVARSADGQPAKVCGPANPDDLFR